MDRKQRYGAKVYGKKVFVPGAAAAAAIFASDSPPVNAMASKPKSSPVRNALEDVTKTLSNFRLGNQTCCLVKEAREETRITSKGKKRRVAVQSTSLDIKGVKVSSQSTRTCIEGKEDPRRKWLEPLTGEYEKSGVHHMTIRKWNDILDEEWGLEKIAESSYAEVYKVSNSDGTSVLKVMALRPPTGPGSQRETSVDVASVVSEVLIMDMMAEIPGFLEFKGAHIIEGKPPKAIRRAYEAHATKSESFFPKPGSYNKDQLFLALELGDAGTDIEHFKVTAVSQLWDIFFGIVIGLSHGEELASFEHRDLHEGNVCVKQVGNLISCAPKQRHKYKYSGLEVTLLDYTLSRATQGDVTIFRDLEQDPELFQESNLLQHQMYRRMRTWAFFRSHGLSHPSLNKPNPPSRNTWKDFMPYTNVIWIWYLFDYTIRKYDGALPLKGFMKETKELREKLNPDRRCFHGGFGCASEILDYCVGQGWIDEEDLMDSDLGSGLGDG